MKHLALLLALTTALPAHAGGPVIIEEPEELATGKDDKPSILPLLIGIGLLAILAGSGGGGDPVGGGKLCNGPGAPGPGGC